MAEELYKTKKLSNRTFQYLQFNNLSKQADGADVGTIRNVTTAANVTADVKSYVKQRRDKQQVVPKNGSGPTALISEQNLPQYSNIFICFVVMVQINGKISEVVSFGISQEEAEKYVRERSKRGEEDDDEGENGRSTTTSTTVNNTVLTTYECRVTVKGLQALRIPFEQIIQGSDNHPETVIAAYATLQVHYNSVHCIMDSGEGFSTQGDGVNLTAQTILRASFLTNLTTPELSLVSTATPLEENEVANSSEELLRSLLQSNGGTRKRKLGFTEAQQLILDAAKREKERTQSPFEMMAVEAVVVGKPLLYDKNSICSQIARDFIRTNGGTIFSERHEVIVAFPSLAVCLKLKRALKEQKLVMLSVDSLMLGSRLNNNKVTEFAGLYNDGYGKK